MRVVQPHTTPLVPLVGEPIPVPRAHAREMPPHRRRKSRDWNAGAGESRGSGAPGRRCNWRVRTSDRGDKTRGWTRRLRPRVRAESGEPIPGSAQRVRRGRPDADQSRRCSSSGLDLIPEPDERSGTCQVSSPPSRASPRGGRRRRLGGRSHPPMRKPGQHTGPAGQPSADEIRQAFLGSRRVLSPRRAGRRPSVQVGHRHGQ